MKRLLVGLMGLMLLAGMSSAIVRVADFPVATGEAVYNTTLTTAETVYSVVLTNEGATVQIDMQAIGGDIYYAPGGTTTEAKWTIGQDQTKWNQYPWPIAASTTLYFWSASNGVTIEVWQNFLK